MSAPTVEPGDRVRVTGGQLAGQRLYVSAVTKSGFAILSNSRWPDAPSMGSCPLAQVARVGKRGAL